MRIADKLLAATFCNTGLALSWKLVSFGCEWRWGKATYDGLGFNDDYDDYTGGEFDGTPSVDDLLTDLENLKFKTKTFRVYFSFRF